MTRRIIGKNSVSSATGRYREAGFSVQIFANSEWLGHRILTFATGLFDWARTRDEDVHESSRALLPVRAGRYVRDADQRPK